RDQRRRRDQRDRRVPPLGIRAGTGLRPGGRDLRQAAAGLRDQQARWDHDGGGGGPDGGRPDRPPGPVEDVSSPKVRKEVRPPDIIVRTVQSSGLGGGEAGVSRQDPEELHDRPRERKQARKQAAEPESRPERKPDQIGRASCRERVSGSAGAGSYKRTSDSDGGA